MVNTFNNPTVALDFVFDETPVKGEPIEPKVKPEEPEEPQKVTEKTEPISTEEDSLNITDPVKKEEKVTDPIEFTEEVIDEEPEVKDNVYLNTINKLADLGIIKEAFDGWDQEADPTEDTLLKMLEHNSAKRDESTVHDFYNSLSPLAQRIVSFDLDAQDPEILDSYLRSLSQENEIKSFDPSNEYDQEQIVRTWYRQETSSGQPMWSEEEIEERIKNLKDSALLEKEANTLKPKLDVKAEEIAKREEESQRSLKQIENQRKASYYERVEEHLAKGEIGGIRLDQGVAKEIYSTLVMDNVPVKLPEGRQIKMPLLEALIFQHKYHPQGDIEALALAAFILKDKEKFKTEFAKFTTTEVTNKFVKDHKYSSAIKSSGNQHKEKKKESRNIPWNLKLK